MFETTRFEGQRRLPSTVVIATGLSAFAAMVVLIAPGILGEVDLEQLFERLPTVIVERFGLAQMGTFEGFLAIEFYEFVWLIGLGAYVAYSAAGTIAGDIEDGRMDTLLAAPISRSRLLLEKYLALLVPILVVNAVVFGVVVAAAAVIDEPITYRDLLAVHALSVPYLLLCGSVGMLASVLTPRRLVAEGVAAGAIIGTFLVQTVVEGTSASWLGAVAPMRYYEPLAILTASEYDLMGTAILSIATVAFLLVSVLLFVEVDVE